MPAELIGQTRPGSAPTSPAGRGARITGVDVGGTFTDLVAAARDGTLRVLKVPSTPPDFHRAVLDAVRQVVEGEEPGAARVVHGSTVATNALLQRKGEPVAFVTTEGFRDMLLIGRQNRPDLYALRVRRPPPITPEVNWFTIRERIDAAGAVVEPLTGAERLADEETAAVEVYADVRFRGQSHELTIRVHPPRWAAIDEAFRANYEARYGRSPHGRVAELVTLRLRRIGRAPEVSLPELSTPETHSLGTVTLLDASGASRAAPAVTRSALAAGSVVNGPMLIVDPEATTYLPPDWAVRGRPDGTVVLARASE